jgi:uncharacterized protein (TIGR00255 family)
LLSSMTGFGTGRANASGIEVSVQIRAVNNRYLKLSIRGSDPYPFLESEFEKLAKPFIRRGTVTIQISIKRPTTTAVSSLNVAILKSYLDQLSDISQTIPPAALQGLYSGVLELPGVATPVLQSLTAPEDEWPIVDKATKSALAELVKSRQHDGQLMTVELEELRKSMSDRLTEIRRETPTMMNDYRKRLMDRIKTAVQESGIAIDESHLIRELSLYADRTDVTEEVVRLEGHFQAVAVVLKQGGDGAGKRLEFLAQEMGREANTLGSKAGSSPISRYAIEIKTALEKFREIALNVE